MLSDPEQRDYQNGIATTLANLGYLFAQKQDMESAEAAYAESIGYLRSLTNLADDVQYPTKLATVLDNLAQLEVGRDTAAAEAHLRESSGILTRLVTTHPAVLKFQSDLALSHNNLASMYAGANDSQRAATSYREAIEIGHRLVSLAPSAVGFHLDLAISHNNLGQLLLGQGLAEEALAQFAAAVDRFEYLVSVDPTHVAYASSLGGGSTATKELPSCNWADSGKRSALPTEVLICNATRSNGRRKSRGTAAF